MSTWFQKNKKKLAVAALVVGAITTAALLVAFPPAILATGIAAATAAFGVLGPVAAAASMAAFGFAIAAAVVGAGFALYGLGKLAHFLLSKCSSTNKGSEYKNVDEAKAESIPLNIKTDEVVRTNNISDLLKRAEQDVPPRNKLSTSPDRRDNVRQMRVGANGFHACAQEATAENHETFENSPAITVN